MKDADLDLNMSRNFCHAELEICLTLVRTGTFL